VFTDFSSSHVVRNLSFRMLLLNEISHIDMQK
jgi:hypothetical protein